MKLLWHCQLNFFCYKNTIITSLKSQKFTWQPAPVCISFTKSKNILTTYIQLYRLNNFFFHISYPKFHDLILFYSKIWIICLWFFLFYQWFFKIFHVSFKIFNDFLCSLFKKYLFFQKFWWFLQDVSGFLRIFQDFSRFYWFNSRSWIICYRSLFKKYWFF